MRIERINLKGLSLQKKKAYSPAPSLLPGPRMRPGFPHPLVRRRGTGTCLLAIWRQSWPSAQKLGALRGAWYNFAHLSFSGERTLHRFWGFIIPYGQKHLIFIKETFTFLSHFLNLCWAWPHFCWIILVPAQGDLVHGVIQSTIEWRWQLPVGLEGSSA
jgi:hypothetical protein